MGVDVYVSVFDRNPNTFVRGNISDAKEVREREYNDVKTDASINYLGRHGFSHNLRKCSCAEDDDNGVGNWVMTFHACTGFPSLDFDNAIVPPAWVNTFEERCRSALARCSESSSSDVVVLSGNEHIRVRRIHAERFHEFLQICVKHGASLEFSD